MSPQLGTFPPARARIAQKSIALPIALGLAIAATLVSPPAPASAATLGTYTIGDTPIMLNQATSSGLGTLTPTADAATNGMFGPLLDFPVLPMHATLARNGHLITFGSPVKTVEQNGVTFDDWDPTADTHVDTATIDDYNSFCNSAVTMLDGRIVMVSGHTLGGVSSEMMSMTYDPLTRAQVMGSNLNYRRWYVTGLRLPDSRILLLGGAAAKLTDAWQSPDDNSQVATTPEIGTGTSAWTPLIGADSTALFGAEDNHWWYPRAFNGPNGTVVGFSGDRVWSLSTNGTGSVQQTGTLPYNPRVSGSQVMYAPGLILIAGGGEVNNYNTTYGSAQAAVLDVRGATPQATLTDSMRVGRNWLNLTVLPNGEVFANGGTKWGTDAGDDNAVRQSEIWNPGTGTWRPAATNQVTRTYHSTSLVLPSGAVFTGGGGNPGPVDNFNAELYFPSYLFTAAADGTVQWASRPAITSIAGNATYGGDVALTIADGRAIQSASLISMPSVTHAQNTDQRRIPLAIRQQGNTVTATLPASVNTAVPGDYELTVVDKNGVPSTAQILSLRNGAAGLVTVIDGTAVQTANPAAAPATAAGGVAQGAAGGAQSGAGAGTTAGTTTTAAGGGGTAGGGATTGATGNPTTGGGTATGAGATGGTPSGGASSGTGTGTSAVRLIRGSTVTITLVDSEDGRVTGSTGGDVVITKVRANGSRSTRRAATYIVRSGLGSGGYSFESLSRPGRFLTVPASGASGSLRLVTKSATKRFAQRATYSVVSGVGHGSSLRVASDPDLLVQVLGSRVVVKRSPAAAPGARATFTLQKGLINR